MSVQLLRAAAHGSKNIGSRPTGAQTQHASKVAMGKNLPAKDTRVTPAVAVGRSPVYTKGGRPSLEGLHDAPRADIQLNNSGYWNPDIQRARNTQTVMDFRSQSVNPIGATNYANRNFTDYRMMGSSSSSQARMAKLRNFNDMF